MSITRPVSQRQCPRSRLTARLASVRPVDDEGEPAGVSVPQPHRVTTRDGTALVLRPLRPSDRQELAQGYDELSAESRRRRFFSPPSRLSPSLLDYLTDLDFDQRFALVAQLGDDPAGWGLGVARWVRDRSDPTRAEAAVTVADEWQGRGIGTQLLLALVEAAIERGITAFLADVLWENTALLDALRERGARIDRSEPGVARVQFDLPEPGTDLDGTAIHRMLVASAGAASP